MASPSFAPDNLMTDRQKMLWAVAAALVLICIVATSTPNLLRSRMAANQAALIANFRTATKQVVTTQLSLGNPNPEKKLIHNAELGLIVSDVHAAVDQMRRLTESNHGQIDKVEINETGGGSLSATLVLRVPASGLETALAEFKNAGLRTEREQVTIRDVTREFYDNDAHMRNLRAEEQQYLTVMKQAHLSRTRWRSRRSSVMFAIASSGSRRRFSSARTTSKCRS